MTLTARAIMESALLTVSPETSLLDIHRLFVEEEIQGAPVVSDDGRVLGVVSSADLLRAVYEEHESGGARADYLRNLVALSDPELGALPDDLRDRLSELRVSDVMTESLVSVNAEAPVSDVARILRKHKVHRVLVLEDDQLVGLVSAFDLVALLEKDPA